MSHYDKKEKSALAVYASIFLLLVLGITVGGYVSYRNFEEEFRRQAEKQVSAIAELKVSQLADWRQERLIDAHSFYHNPVFSELVQRYFQNPADVETRKQIISRMEYYQSYAGYDGLSLLDGTGSHRLVVPANSQDFIQADVLLMTQAAPSLNSGDVFFGDFQRDSNTDRKIYISILIPLFADQSDGHLLGVLILHVNPETYLYPYISHWPIPSDTAETLLVRRDGEDVLFLNELRFTQDAALNMRFPLTDIQLPAVKAVLGQTGLVEGMDYRGKLVLADVRPVPDSPWFMVSKVDVDEVYAPLRERLWQTLLIVGLAILVAGVGLALVWRQQRVLFYRTQAESAGTLRESEEKFRKAFILTPDSININRLSDGMYVSINNGFTKIMGYAPDEVIGKTSLELDIWVDSQDRKTLVDGLMKNGEVENLESCFRAKNGDIKYGLMSASALELNGIPHIISITRDITERKQAEESLHENEEKLRSIFRVAPTGIGLVRDRVLYEVNPRICEMTGYSSEELVGQSARILYPTQEEFEWVGSEKYKQIAEKGSGAVETKWQKKDGSILDVLLASTPIDLADISRGVTFTALDITERKRAEEALRITLAKYKTLFEYFPLGISVTDMAGNILEANPTAEKLLSVPLNEHLQRDIESPAWRIVRLDGTPMPTDEFASVRALREKRVVENVEMGILKPDDSITWLSVTAAPLPVDGHGVVITYGDVTARRKAEEALRDSEKRFRTHYDNTTIGLYRTTPDGNIMMLNPAGVQMLGYDSFDELANRNLEDAGFGMKNSRRGFSEKLEREGVVRGLESQWSRKDGSIIFVRESAQVFRDGTGKILYYDGSFEDISTRVHAEAAWKESEKLYRKMNENSPLGMHFYNLRADNQLIFSGANPAANKLLGVDHSQFIEKTIEQAFPPLAQTEVPKRYRDAAANGIPWSTEQISYEDGQISGAFEVKAFQTTLGNMVAVFNDITARKQAEKALSESEAIYRRAIEVANAVPYRQSYHVNGNTVDYDFIGQGIRQITGYSPDEFNELVWDSLAQERILLNDLAEYSFDEAIQRVRSGVSPVWKCNHRIRARDGKIHWVFEAAVELRDDNGVSYGSIGMFQDITARKQADETLRESEERYRTVVSNAPVVIFVTDEKGIFTLSEGMGLKKLGLHPGQVVGLSVFDVYHDYPPIKEAMQNALAGHNYRHEVEVQGIVFDVFYTPMFDEQGKVSKVIGVSTDVTERRKAEDQIRQFNMELEQRVRDRTVQLETTNKELEAFSYSVSHDLRAPLRGIDGWSQALLEDYRDKLDDQGQRYIERVRSETQRMGHLIDDMLRLSRLARADMIKEQVDLSAMAQRVVERLKRDEPHRLVDFSIQAQIIAEGDPHLLESVLENLLANAFKFTGKRTDARVEFGQTEIKDQRVFFVRDNGSGFNMTYAQKLFGPFQRMHKVSEFPGTGIGLATVQRIIHRHGGRVWAEAEIERGAIFYFTLD